MALDQLRAVPGWHAALLGHGHHPQPRRPDRKQTAGAKPRCSTPESLLAKLQTETPESGLPVELRAWLEQTLDIRLAGREAEWSDGELYVALPRPGGDAWLSLSSETGELEYESTDRGWIAYFNDLHKGRHTGEAWSWFIDFFAVACVVFSLTGLLLLQRHAGNRPSTWPLVGLGLVMPLLLALLFIH